MSLLLIPAIMLTGQWSVLINILHGLFLLLLHNPFLGKGNVESLEDQGRNSVM